MNKEQIVSLLTAISERQVGQRHQAVGPDEGTAPVELSIGYVSGRTNIVMHDGVVIKQAPNAIVHVINQWVDKQEADNEFCSIRVEAGEGGIIIR